MNNRTQKAVAARAAKREEFSAQTITIDDDWRILRSDRYTWEVQHQGKFKGYFGSILTALKSLPASMLDSEASGAVADVQRAAIAICATIEKAVAHAQLVWAEPQEARKG